MASACSIVLANEQASIIGSRSSANLKTRASTCVLMTIAVVCVCTLVVCGVFVVREYSLARTYEPTTCRLGNITYSADVWCLFCSGTKDKAKDNKGGGGGGGGAGGSCVNTPSPCVHISVAYSVNSTERRTALLYQDSVQAIGAFSQCSYSVCMKSREDSLRSIEDYVESWKAKSNDFQCFYDTESPDKAIAHKTYSRLDVIHCMLWPSLVIVACGAVFLRLEANRRGLTFCGTRKDADKVKDKVKDKDGNSWQTSVTTKTADGKQALQKLDDATPGTSGSCGSREPALNYVRRLSTSMSSLERVRPRDRCFVHVSTSPLLSDGGCQDDGGVRRKSISVERLKEKIIVSDSQAANALVANML